MNETYFVENEAQSLIFPIYDEDYSGWYTGQMRNGKRNGIGIMKSVRQSQKVIAYWKDDKPIGQVLIHRFARYIVAIDFKDGLPTGEFTYYFPIVFIKLTGKISIVGENKFYIEGQLVLPTMSFQILGTGDVKEEIAELEYKANCLGKI